MYKLHNRYMRFEFCGILTKVRLCVVDREKEIERLSKEKTKLEGEIKRVESKLGNKGFVDKAPASVVEEEKQKGIKYREMLEKVLEALKNFE